MRLDRDGQTQELDIKGSLLGVFAEMEYQTKVFQLQHGDKLLTYSDGVELAFVNEGSDKPLRFRREFSNLANENAETICHKLVEIIDREEGSLHPRDDVTIVGIDIL
jgi:serine phosphatase RsbU (regulator of sigma subunit)